MPHARSLSMKRILAPVGAFLLSILLVGCGTDSREGLIEDTARMIGQAATEIRNIDKRVNDAVAKSSEKGTKLDLTDAMKAADQLKKAGEEAQKIKRRIDIDRGTVTEEDKEKYSKTSAEKLQPEFEELLKRRNELNASLQKAE